ncbi:hypothetical protein RUM43_006787 [Polyplax serrata]|uniref:Uncharacterized protein n=1 Tax=Polyplax serrata TaxID=468196 RepID=A0AAN8S538_POLSC
MALGKEKVKTAEVKKMKRKTPTGCEKDTTEKYARALTGNEQSFAKHDNKHQKGTADPFCLVWCVFDNRETFTENWNPNLNDDPGPRCRGLKLKPIAFVDEIKYSSLDLFTPSLQLRVPWIPVHAGHFQIHEF